MSSRRNTRSSNSSSVLTNNLGIINLVSGFGYLGLFILTAISLITYFLSLHGFWLVTTLLALAFICVIIRAMSTQAINNFLGRR
jgi:hypothetical protein